MFSGIIEEIGTIKGLGQTGQLLKLQVVAPKVGPSVKVSQSICVNGACLTVVEAERELLCFEVMPETLRHTNLGLLQPQDKVNLERALRVDGRIDGHFVSGHIDGTGIIRQKQQRGSDVEILVDCPAQLIRYIVFKGALALDGVSLTVSSCLRHSFALSLIPYTLKNTTLSLKKEKDIVNIECDILAKYAAKFLNREIPSSSSNISLSFLQEHGF